MMKKKLKEFANLLNGYAFKSKNYVSSGIRIMRIANVKEGYIGDEQPCYYPEDAHEKIEKYMLKAGDMLISLTGNVGRIGIMPVNMLPAALNQRVCCIRLKDDSVNKKYLFYFFQRKSFIQDCVKASKGVAQLNLSTKFLKEYSVPVPPLPEQERIVARIEELFSELDKAVETLKTIKQQLAVYRQVVLKEAFAKAYSTGELYEICQVCSDIKVGIVIKPSQYYTDSENGIKAFRSANVREFHIENKDWVYLSNEGHEANMRSKLHTGDVAIVRSGYPGTACVITDEYDGCNAIDILIAVPNREVVLSEYLCAFTNSPDGRALVRKKKRGVAQSHLNVSGYSKIKIPVPSIIEQKQIVQDIDNHLSICNSIEKTVDTALQQAEAMRQSILKQAFGGRL